MTKRGGGGVLSSKRKERGGTRARSRRPKKRKRDDWGKCWCGPPFFVDRACPFGPTPDRVPCAQTARWRASPIERHAGFLCPLALGTRPRRPCRRVPFFFFSIVLVDAAFAYRAVERRRENDKAHDEVFDLSVSIRRCGRHAKRTSVQPSAAASLTSRIKVRQKRKGGRRVSQSPFTTSHPDCRMIPLIEQQHTKGHHRHMHTRQTCRSFFFLGLDGRMPCCVLSGHDMGRRVTRGHPLSMTHRKSSVLPSLLAVS